MFLFGRETLTFSVHTDLTKAKEVEENMSAVKLSFEKQLQNERTLKTQVSGWVGG